MFHFCSPQLYQIAYICAGWVVEAIRKITSHASRHREGTQPLKGYLQPAARSPDGWGLHRCTVATLVTQWPSICVDSRLSTNWRQTLQPYTNNVSWDWPVIDNKIENSNKWQLVALKKTRIVYLLAGIRNGELTSTKYFKLNYLHIFILKCITYTSRNSCITINITLIYKTEIVLNSFLSHVLPFSNSAHCPQSVFIAFTQFLE